MSVETSRQPSRVGVAIKRIVHPSVLELVAMAMLALAYNVIRAGQGGDVALAFVHSDELVALEGWVFDHVEVPLNSWTMGVPLVAVPACYFYAVMHYVATPTVLFLSWKVGGWKYRRGYWSLVLASAVALLVYMNYPVAPPRLVPGDGVADVMRAFAGYGWWGGAASAPRGIGDATNQYAALPSLHCGWALWCALQMWDFKGRWWRPLAVLYPSAQAFVVIATGNHYVIDVLLGCGLVLATHFALDAFGKRRFGWDSDESPGLLSGHASTR
ncbi:hypothetical protein DJ010_01125 [Nocardioides silvaticus]|uniref:Inositolphosphotransferase Aur1/Ipt1 domain-containing protein n=2 Tax=Nocardioides silvaticus TaxID=2201891 RepID=A0A316TQ03_9ACTN|nr:hypothetical protein DJ010_01125 [Nocardioides silvaticus]